MPKEGWIRRGVDYVVVLDQDGKCLDITFTDKLEKGKIIPREMLLPAIGKQALKHTNSGEDANLLWDNASFVFGTGNKGTKKIASFISTLIQWLDGLQDEGFIAIKNFCSTLQADPNLLKPLLEKFKVIEEFEKRDPTLVFRLISDTEEIHARQAIREHYEKKLLTTEYELKGNCLITGNKNVSLTTNEIVIKGILGGQPAGCNIVSFNQDSFISYGKRGRNGENAPIGVSASFAYTTALNHLLSTDIQCVQIGDASTVFWAEQPHDMETMARDLFGEPPKSDPDRGAGALHALYQSVNSGRFSVGEEGTRFYVLGLAPNAARISIRFWEAAPAIELARRIKRHFDDLKIARTDYDPVHLSLFRLLTSIAVQGKADNIPPNLGGDIMRAILEELPYPVTLLNSAVQRCRAERKVNYPRAAILKACINRHIRNQPVTLRSPLPEKEFKIMLDSANPCPAYRLGRLFAVLEKTQEEAIPGIKASIRDRYYGAASSTPVAVLLTLLRLKNHHLSKLSKGRAIQMEKLIGEIMDGIADFPRIFTLPEQGRFALGYYHQRQSFFIKTDSKTTDENQHQENNP